MADEAWRWYEGNREKFRYPIYVPILHMTVPDGRSAMLLENLIAVRDLPMFIFGCKEDEALLTDRRHSWKLNSTVMPTSQIDVSSLKTTLTQEMKELGFTHFAIDLFESVDVIKQYLCNVAKLHQVPIGSSKTNDLYDTIKTLFSRNSYKLYLTDRYRVQFTVSKYGSREILGQQSELKSPARLFVAHSTSLDERHKVHADIERVRNWEADLRSRRMELNQTREQIQREKELLREQQAEWKTRREALMNFERSLNNRERKLEDVITNRPDFDQAMAALVETKINASKEVYKVTLKLLCKLEELRVMRVKETFIKVILNQLSNKEKEFEKELFSLEEKLQNNMSLMESQFEMFRGIREEFTRVQECLHDKCGLKTLDAEKMIREEKKVLEILEKLFIEENIPDSILDVVRLLEEEKVKLDIATVDGSKEDVDRCERLKQEKATLLGRKDQQEAVKEAWMAELMNVSFYFMIVYLSIIYFLCFITLAKVLKEITEWRNTVEQLIRSISSNYSKFFAQIGCAGEVYLDVPEDLSDISEYGIMVMVSFRSGERLRRLDHQVQSGGERSVSTMLYLLALQELCLVPFRCVDEINQGMDPTNERKVFDIIVNALSGDGNLAKTQYFLLTPKLLHGLKFNRNVTVQIVHNGATLSKNCHNWDVDNFLAIMKSRYGH
ncbi:hypothetical protein DICVIV_04092 [Dictyocaulus viviparus]|uniref:Structural maintenance of chromosomes protein 5 n=1 Tax=Dictyocaulus viviparus TaxID=29172 RepID=A0A0D8Y0U1_DICVI|nr:hypothetical protein DICVIV_04092 [Dictyocaulus viviparus]